MQRRTGLARALSYPAPLLLLDEAFDSLDEKNKYKVADLFLSIVKKEKRTAVCVTHDAPFAKKIADKIIRYPMGTRKAAYTTNALESLNFNLRTIIHNKSICYTI